MLNISFSKERFIDLFLGGESNERLDKITSDYEAWILSQEKEKYCAEKELDMIFQEMFKKTGMKIGGKYKVTTYNSPIEQICTLECYIWGTRHDRYWLDFMFKKADGHDIWTALNIRPGGWVKYINGSEQFKTFMHYQGESRETDNLIDRIYSLNMTRIKSIKHLMYITSAIGNITGIKFHKTELAFTLKNIVVKAVPVNACLSGKDSITFELDYKNLFQALNEEEILSVTWEGKKF